MKHLSLLFIGIVALVAYVLWQVGMLQPETPPVETALETQLVAPEPAVEDAAEKEIAMAQGHDLAAIAKDYFTVYAQRKDFEGFMAFYADDATLEDMIYGHFAIDKQEIAAFLDWSKGDFAPLDDRPVLEITEQVVQGRRVITRGYFTRFSYFGEEHGPWRFVIWLEFDDGGKIRRHIDWINYTPRNRYLGGQNRNQSVN